MDIGDGKKDKVMRLKTVGSVRQKVLAVVRNYMMYFALVAIMLFFTQRTNGRFFQAKNISDLFNQSAYVGVLAIGMTLILILRHIDLSVGYVAGFSGAIAAILLANGMNVILAIFLVLLLGLAIGMYQGLVVTRIGVPAFVVTLAGMFIFRGLLALSLQKTGTIIISNPIFISLCQGFLPDIPGHGLGFHLVTMILALILVVWFAVSRIRSRRKSIAYRFQVSHPLTFVFQLLVVSAVILYIFYMLASFNGLPWSAVIVATVLFIYHFVLNNTRIGRYIYAIGGSTQAAELAGINVKLVTSIAFASMGFLAALAGMLYASRLSSATPQAGVGFELDAIASGYIGGVAVSGGIGKVTNTIVGTLVIMSLTNGMNLLGIDISLQYIVKGLIFIIAVAFDVRTRLRR